MGKRDNVRARRRLSLQRETLRRLAARDLAQVAGGTDYGGTWGCPVETADCDTSECWFGTTSKFC
jgi:hypothetical protein